VRIFLSFWLLLLVMAPAGAWASPAPEEMLWKPITNGVLKVDERPVKTWEIYLTKKYKHWALVQIGARFLLLDAEAKEIFEISPDGLQRKGNELHWKADLQAPTAQPTPENGLRVLLPSDEWSDKYAGRARIIRLLLSGEGRRLDVQLPATPDLRKFY